MQLIISVPQALSCLRQHTFTISPKQAVEYLEIQLNSSRIISLYQHFFPAQHASSTASLYSNEPSIHSPLELEFLEHLSNLIPLADFGLDAAQEERLYSLPITPMGIQWMEDLDVESLREEWQILLPLSKEGRYFLEAYEGSEWYEAEFGLKMQTIAHPDTIDRSSLTLLDFPKTGLNAALALLDHETNNLWLDAYEWEEREWCEWTIENVEKLAREWKKAQVVLDEADSLIDWLSLDLPNHFQEVLKVWNSLAAKSCESCLALLPDR